MSGIASSVKINSVNKNTTEELEEKTIEEEQLETEGIFFDWATGFFHIRFDWSDGGRVTPLLMGGTLIEKKFSEGIHYCTKLWLEFDSNPSSIKTADYGLTGRDYSDRIHRLVAYCAFYVVLDAEFYDWDWYSEITYIEIVGYAPMMRISPR